MVGDVELLDEEWTEEKQVSIETACQRPTIHRTDREPFATEIRIVLCFAKKIEQREDISFGEEAKHTRNDALATPIGWEPVVHHRDPHVRHRRNRWQS
jgi:hypothetical protein